MCFFYFEAGVGQALADFAGYHYRTVMASGAAEGDGEIAFAFANVVRNEIDQQLRDAVDEFHGLRERADVAGHSGVTSGEVLEFRNVVGIGKEAHVENQVAIGWDAMAIAKAGDVDANISLLAAAAKFVFNHLAQLMHVEFGGIDDVVRDSANGRQLLAFFLYAFGYRCSDSERMRTAGFAKAAHQRAVVGLQINQRGGNAAPEFFVKGR